MGLLLEDPARGFTLVCLLWPWQPLQTDREDGQLYSDMQEAEKRMAEGMGIKVLAFEFKEAEVSEVKPHFPTGDLKFKEEKRDETAFKQRAWSVFCSTMVCADKK